MAINEFRSSISKARNLGGAKSGTDHFIHQRYSAVLLIPAIIWLFYILFNISDLGSVSLLTYLANPINTIMAIYFCLVGLYHGMLGIKVIIEDYVHCHKLRMFSLIILYFSCYMSMVAGTLCFIGIHIKFFYLQTLSILS